MDMNMRASPAVAVGPGRGGIIGKGTHTNTRHSPNMILDIVSVTNRVYMRVQNENSPLTIAL